MYALELIAHVTVLLKMLVVVVWSPHDRYRNSLSVVPLRRQRVCVCCVCVIIFVFCKKPAATKSIYTRSRTQKPVVYASSKICVCAARLRSYAPNVFIEKWGW